MPELTALVEESFSREGDGEDEQLGYLDDRFMEIDGAVHERLDVFLNEE